MSDTPEKDTVTLRMAGAGDVEALLQVRLDYLRHTAGGIGTFDTEEFRCALRDYFTRNIPSGGCVAFLAFVDGTIASAALLAVSECPPNPDFPNGRVGTLMSVLTYPEYRRRGLAARVIAAVIAEAGRLGVQSINLLATDEGRNLYEKLGFRPADYTPMRLLLPMGNL